MPTVTEKTKQIPKLYRRNALNLLMFAYVRGVTSTLHTVGYRQAIDMFMDDFGLTDETYNRESAKTAYCTMQKEMIGAIRHENNLNESLKNT